MGYKIIAVVSFGIGYDKFSVFSNFAWCDITPENLRSPIADC